MYSIFISKINKLLNLNPFENPKLYEQLFIKREFRLPAVDHDFFESDLILPDVEYDEYQLTSSTMASKLKFDTDQCSYGIRSEKIVVRHLNKYYEINECQSSVKYPVIDNYQLFGKLDGIIDNKILEIKCRTTTFRGITKFEMPQIQLYMMASGLIECIFIEAYDNKLKAYLVNFDVVYTGLLIGEIKKLALHLEEYRVVASS